MTSAALPPEGGVIITAAQMYAQQVATTAALQRLEGKVDGMTHALQLRDQEKERVHGDHETRIRTLERASWKLAGVATVAGVVSSGAAVAILQAISHGG